MDYGFNFQGAVFTPGGRADIAPADVATSNQAKEQVELDWLRTHPEKVFLYVTQSPTWKITTWPGTVIDACPYVGTKRLFRVFGARTTRRAVECRIFGARYVGWYFESSGDYCRLRKAKRQ